METEIHLFLRYCVGIHSGSGAVLGSGDAKVNELDSGCKETSVCGEAGGWAGDNDAVWYSNQGVPRMPCGRQLLLCLGMAEGFPVRDLWAGSRSWQEKREVRESELGVAVSGPW